MWVSLPVYKYTTNDCHKIFLFVTTEISTNKIPLIHQVIPYFDMITTALEDAIDNPTIPSTVRHAALRGYFMLNKYYSLTDNSIVYRIAMSTFSCTFCYVFLTNSFFFCSPPPPLQDDLLYSCEVACGVDFCSRGIDPQGLGWEVQESDAFTRNRANSGYNERIWSEWCTFSDFNIQ